MANGTFSRGPYKDLNSTGGKSMQKKDKRRHLFIYHARTSQ